MKINVDDYHLSKEFVQSWYKKYGNNDPNNSISIISVATGVPCIVTAFYIGEISGWTKELVDKIKFLEEFYGYTNIVNIPENYPKGEQK